MKARQFPRLLEGCCVGLVAAVVLCAVGAYAQTPRNPFAVGGQEIGGRATGIMGWLLSEQSALYLKISNAVRAAKQDGSAFWGLAAISFAYGVFHAAGPGHGKAVVASYMLANERALRRGLIISFLAALLQGLVAIALIGVLAILFNATARAMNDAAAKIDTLSFAGIAGLGLWLVWSKGVAFVVSWRLWRARRSPRGSLTMISPGMASAERPSPHSPPINSVAAHIAHRQDHHVADRHGYHDHRHDHDGHEDHTAHEHATRAQAEHPLPGPSTIPKTDHVHDAHCGHFHAPDPASLAAGFSWKTALMTLLAAGTRPCAGALLVLVFALSQGIFWAGIGATLAMSLGTAITTGALASLAVLAKSLASRIASAKTTNGELAVRGLELAAALCVFVFGFGLLCGILEYGA
jgi:nickel/cobalt transporter (NicO) family protein